MRIIGVQVGGKGKRSEPDENEACFGFDMDALAIDSKRGNAAVPVMGNPPLAAIGTASAGGMARFRKQRSVAALKNAGPCGMGDMAVSFCHQQCQSSQVSQCRVQSG